MPIAELEPNVDAYGTYARASAIADFLEVAALHGARPRQANVADYIQDVSWGAKIHETYLSPSQAGGAADVEGEGLGSDAEEAAERVFAMLRQRAEVLGALYPFRTLSQGNVLELVDSGPNQYLGLLGITVAHALDIQTDLNPRDVFEETVSRALEGPSQRSLNFSLFRKDYSSFPDALDAAGPVLNLRPTPLAAPVSLFAQDAGGDVLVHVEDGYTPGDSFGAWIMVGQVTCGQSDTWEKKLGEVHGPAWRDRLNSALEPQAFLAVPHHVERNHLEHLVTGSNRMVLDRLRLTRMLGYLSEDEESILEAVSGAPMASVVSRL